MTTDSRPPTLGESLQALREERGLTVEQVAAATRLRVTLVRDLEADSYTSSGAPVYARGHIRNIAGVLGVDAAPLVARFDREVGLEPPTALTVAAPAPVLGLPSTPGRMTIPSAQLPERRGPNWLVAGVAAVGALVALIGIGTVVDPTRKPADEASLIGTTPPTVAPTAAPAPQPLPSEATAQAPAFDGADLRVRIIDGASWVRVRNSARKTLFEGVLQEGMSKDFRDKTALSVVVGNAGAVSIVCSGKDLPRAGGNGKIARFSCSDTGLVSA